MDKYNPLYTYLCGNNEDQIILDFSEIEEIIGDKLPKSALNYAAWWSNSTKGGQHPYASRVRGRIYNKGSC